MCVISENIKFCSCVDDNIDIDALNHYWVLYRYNKHLDIEVLGEVMLPFDKLMPNYKENARIIFNALMGKESFDKPMRFKEQDRLQIVLNNTSKNREDSMEFEFAYNSGIWESIDDPDPFYIINHFDDINSGEIKEIKQGNGRNFNR